VRRYPNGKLLIKPSKKNVKTFLEGIRRTIKAAHGVSAADLIDQLNPKIRGWANYHRHVVSKRTFGRVDYSIFSSLWKWARRRHPNKSPRWFKPKYFAQRGNRDWSFFGETCDDEGQTNKVWLHYAKSTPIKRHVKGQRRSQPVRSNLCNPLRCDLNSYGDECLVKGAKEQTVRPIERTLRLRTAGCRR
jgi:RNA-directed DNA polymerase